MFSRSSIFISFIIILCGFTIVCTSNPKTTNAIDFAQYPTLFQQVDYGSSEYQKYQNDILTQQVKASVNTTDIQRVKAEKDAAEQAAIEAEQALEQEQYNQYYSYNSGSTYSGGISDISDIIYHESRGDTYASNGKYKGIGQLDESYYQTYLGKSWSEVSGDYAAQQQAMESYIVDRYGSDQNAINHWNSYGWY